MSENTQGPKKDPLNPSDNHTGHQWGSGQIIDRGYARCKWCDCRENTTESAAQCLQAYKARVGSGPVQWFRKSKWLPPSNSESKT